MPGLAQWVDQILWLGQGASLGQWKDHWIRSQGTWVVGPVWAGYVTLGKLLSPSGPQHLLLNDEELNFSAFSPPRQFHKVHASHS